MDSVLINGENADSLSNAATEYNTISAGSNWSTISNDRKQLISAPGKIKNLYVELSAAPGAGDAFIFTLIVNGAPSALVVTISGGADTQGFDATEVDVVAGDEVQIRSTYTGSPGTPSARWSFMFTSDNAKESNILGSVGTGTAAIIYCKVTNYNSSGGGSATQNEHRVVIPTNGTIKNLYVELSQAPGTGGDAWTFTLQKGTPPGALGDTALVVTITEPDRTGNNVADSVAVSAGDVVVMKVTETGTAVDCDAFFGFTFVADTDGESLILGGGNSNLRQDGTPEYNPLQNYFARTWAATETSRYQLGQAMTLKKFYVLLGGPPGSGDAYTFKVRLNETDPASGLSVTITDASTTGNDVANEVAVTNSYDEVAIKAQASGTPVGRDAYWGVVAYIAPVVVGGSGRSAAGAAMLLM